jgi:hypothetical protein
MEGGLSKDPLIVGRCTSTRRRIVRSRAETSASEVTGATGFTYVLDLGKMARQQRECRTFGSVAAKHWFTSAGHLEFLPWSLGANVTVDLITKATPDSKTSRSPLA